MLKNMSWEGRINIALIHLWNILDIGEIESTYARESYHSVHVLGTEATSLEPQSVI